MTTTVIMLVNNQMRFLTFEKLHKVVQQGVMDGFIALTGSDQFEGTVLINKEMLLLVGPSKFISQAIISGAVQHTPEPPSKRSVWWATPEEMEQIEKKKSED